MGAQSLGLPPIKCIMYADLGEMPFFQGESGALEVPVDKVVFRPGLEGDQVWNHHPCTALFSLPRHTLIFGILLCTPLSLTGRRCGVMFRASPRLHPTEDTYSVLSRAGISRRMHSKHKAPTAYSSWARYLFMIMNTVRGSIKTCISFRGLTLQRTSTTRTLFPLQSNMRQVRKTSLCSHCR